MKNKPTTKMKSEALTKHPKFIFVVGGVISGVGKGIAASSIGALLKARGHTVTAIKIDPYVNVDAGTMNPTEHGEVFVLADGDECDQDMGNYERFLDTTLSKTNYMTTGRVYQTVIQKERNLEYKGKCVQVVPHIPLEVISRIKRAQKEAGADVVIIEIGGTVGEYENILFLEAARMLKIENHDDVAFVMVSYLPVPSKVGEMKTKPTQHAVRNLNATGIQPDVILARSNTFLDDKRKEKLALFCNVRPERIISAPDVDSVYDIPTNFERDNLGNILCEVLQLKDKHKSTLNEWTTFFNKAKKYTKEVNIAVVGKYFDTGDFVLSDSYISIIESLKYAAYALKVKPVLHWLNSKDFEIKNTKKLAQLKKFDGILVPGGFGSQGVEGKINVIRYARENKIPFFGICYGMQLAVIEYARNVLAMKDAHTTEVNPASSFPVIDILPEQKEKLLRKEYGNSMRLGTYKANLKEKTLAHKAYQSAVIDERHRHRYEVNPEYVAKLQQKDLRFSGTSPDGTLMEICELPLSTHPFFLAVQFHPEFKSRPFTPHPLFKAFVSASLKKKKV
jgi:CTP synthase